MVILFLLAVLVFARETPFGKFTHRLAVETRDPTVTPR